MAAASRLVSYVSGRFVKKAEALVNASDASFLYGFGIHDSARTYGGRLHGGKLDEHVARFLRSAALMRLESPLDHDGWVALCHETVARNAGALRRLPGGDAWLSLRLSPGVDGFAERVPGGRVPAKTVIAELRPLPLRARAAHYVDGVPLAAVAAHRRVPDACVPSEAKTHSYVAQHLANLAAADVGALPLMLSVDGLVAEGSTYNVFAVDDKGRLLTPTTNHCLAGVSRGACLRLARRLGLDAREVDLTLDDFKAADEAFVTSTSFCLCPVRSVDGARVGGPEVWGPVTTALRDAYVADCGVDFVRQYLDHLEEAPSEAPPTRP